LGGGGAITTEDKAGEKKPRGESVIHREQGGQSRALKLLKGGPQLKGSCSVTQDEKRSKQSRPPGPGEFKKKNRWGG